MSTEVQQSRNLETIALEIQALHSTVVRTALDGAVEIGRRLVEAKEMVAHGGWESWLESSVPYSQTKATRMMRLYEEYGDPQGNIFGATVKSSALTDLTPTHALELLALPESEREAFVEENDVKNMSSRELKKAIKERDEAKKEADRLDEEVVAAETALRKAEEKLDTLSKELAELKNTPNEVIEGHSDEALEKAVEKAKKEAEAAANQKIVNAESAKASAEEKLKAASANAELLQKQLAAASNETITVFKTHFETVQVSINAMLTCLEKLSDDPDMQEKLGIALKTLCNQTADRCNDENKSK